MPIRVDPDARPAERRLPARQFAAAVGIASAGLALVKNGRARAARFPTLDTVCHTPGYRPGEVLHPIPQDD